MLSLNHHRISIQIRGLHNRKDRNMIKVYIRNGIGLYGRSFDSASWQGVFSGIGSLRIIGVRVRKGQVIAYARS